MAWCPSDSKNQPPFRKVQHVISEMNSTSLIPGSASLPGAAADTMAPGRAGEACG